MWLPVSSSLKREARTSRCTVSRYERSSSCALVCCASKARRKSCAYDCSWRLAASSAAPFSRSLSSKARKSRAYAASCACAASYCSRREPSAGLAIGFSFVAVLQVVLYRLEELQRTELLHQEFSHDERSSVLVVF